jgi:hypothetical protein
LSQAALRKTGDQPGFQDTELTEAYNIAVDQDEHEFTIIPIRLEDCGRGDHRLSLYQQFDVFADWDATLDRLAVSLGGCSRAKGVTDIREPGGGTVEALQGKLIACHAAGEPEKAIHAVQELIQILVNGAEPAGNRRAAAAALRWADPNPDRVIRPLLRALSDRDPVLWQLAGESLLSLGLFGRDDALEPLLPALAESSNQVRFYAVAAIGRIGPAAQPAIPELSAVLGDASWKVRRIAAEALGALGPAARPAIDRLVECLRSDQNDWVRSNAATALAKIDPGAAAVRAALSLALRDGSEKVRNAARRALDSE